jgi:hypothetical protein
VIWFSSLDLSSGSILSDLFHLIKLVKYEYVFIRGESALDEGSSSYSTIYCQMNLNM